MTTSEVMPPQKPELSVDDSVFRTIVEGSIQGILIHREQKPLFLNDAWARIHGLTVDEVLALPNVLGLIHPDERERMLGYMRLRMAGKSAPDRYEYRGLHRNGSTIWLENIVRPVEWQGEPAIQAVIVDITQRKYAEHELRESEERFRRGFEHGPIGVFFVDRELQFIRANRAFCDLVGYDESELSGMNLRDITPQQESCDDEPCPDTDATDFQDFTIRKQYRRRDGSLVWTRVSSHWVRDDAGQPTNRMTFVENITERVQARQALEASERRFRNLVEGSIQGIIIHRDDRPLFVNDAWANILGYSIEEILQAKSTLDFIAPQDRERLQSYRVARTRGEPAPSRYEYQGQRKDGSLVWLENNVRVVDWDGRPAVQSTIIDVTERKLREGELVSFNAELERRVLKRTAELETSNVRLQKEIAERTRIEYELRNARTLYESLVESIPLCVARKNLAGQFVFANRALRDVLGGDLGEIIGKDDYAFSPPELADKYRADDLRVIQTGEQLDFVEMTNFGRPEGERYIHTLKTPIRDADGVVNGTQLIFWDVTAETRARQAQAQAQEELQHKNRDLTSLLYVISHDLKEPVRAIQSFAMLVVDRYAGQLEEKGRDFLRRVIDASSRMQHLLDDVLMLSRAQRTIDPKDTVDLNTIARDVLIQAQARIEETQAQVQIVGTLPTIRGDRRWLNQAVLNLVVNALKFTNPGAAPEIEIAGCEITEGDWVLPGIVIRDRGPGVDSEHHERIFELFQRAVSRQVEGTGAGLAIVRQVAEGHLGRAFVRSREGGGSEFVMTFGTTFNGFDQAAQ